MGIKTTTIVNFRAHTTHGLVYYILIEQPVSILGKTKTCSREYVQQLT